MVIVDFKEAMWKHEHFSETTRPERQMMDFIEVLSHCDLHDLGFAGIPYHGPITISWGCKCLRKAGPGGR